MGGHSLRTARLAAVVMGLLASAGQASDPGTLDLVIASPREGAVYPRDFAPPWFRWKDESGASRWRVSVILPDGQEAVSSECSAQDWRPEARAWERIKSQSLDRSAVFSVSGIATVGGRERTTSSGRVSFQTSPDPVGAPIFYREVPLPVGFAMDNKPLISWKLGDVSSLEAPRTVLSKMSTCANCHSFSADGKTLAMDLDFGADKGSYAIASIGREVQIGRQQLVTWNDYRREDGQTTLGFLSTISPDGKRVVSTVKETIVLKFLPDLWSSQIFLPVRGILAVYDRATGRFEAIRGADDPAFVQTNPAFSPDGRWLVFARARVPDIPGMGLAVEGGTFPALVDEYADGRRKIRYDLYRVLFDEGRGGEPEPVRGASENGKSNYFARYSPDGKWIVFCQADSMMLNRPDSALFIVPASGGMPRRLGCNAPGRMNSWHSFSPNGRWLVFASKAEGPMTQMWLTHIDPDGRDTPPVLLDGFVATDRAANLPEFVTLDPGQLREIRIDDEIRNSAPKLPARPR